MENLLEELEWVKAKIDDLQSRQRQIEKELLDSDLSFLQKFKIWYEGESEGYQDWIIDTPLLYKYFKDEQRYDRYNRGETVDLESLFGDEIMFVFTDEGAREEYSEEDFNEILEKYTPIMQEAMENDIKSFKFDW